MTEKPLISVLMGVYNCSSTLDEAVNCIINQTYTNWELIICDDCSTDNTYDLACKIAAKDSRIVVIKNNQNKTLAPTLNACLAIAQGQYIARMDGDDRCSPERFAKELNFLSNHPEYALVSCQMELFDKDGAYKTIIHSETPTTQELVKRSQFCHAGCMMKTEVMKELRGYDESLDYKRVEDYDLWVRLYSLGYKGYNLQEILYSMRDDRNAISRRSFRNRLNESKLKCKIIKIFSLSKKNYIYVILPIIKYFIPTFLYKRFHRK